MATSLPLLRAGVIEVLVLGARRAGIPVRRHLRAAGLPDLPWGEEDPHLPLPLAPSMDFLEIVARKEGFPLFGIHAAVYRPLQSIRSLHLDLEDCANLLQVLQRFIARARLQGTQADYRLEVEEELVWLRHRGRFPRANALQSDLSTLASMVETVRIVAGPQWHPHAMEVSARPSRHLLQSSFFGTDRIAFERPCRGIALPRALLAKKKPPGRTAPSPAPRLPPPMPGQTFSDQLQAVLPAYLAGAQLNEALVARITGMSFRTVQRRLAQEGQTYSGIIARARQKMAQQLLQESDEKLADVARQLGYANLSNFTRAFRRWTGVTPSEYRQLHRAGQPLAVTNAA